MLECQAMMEPQAQQRGITMTFPRFERPLLRHFRSDPVEADSHQPALQRDQIQQGAGTVGVDCTVNAAGRTRISIKDTGAGLRPEKLAQLFQPFNRLGQEAGGEEGTGIGLVVTKRLVELMGGAIGVESEVGAGSVFWIELNSAAAPQLVDGGEAPAYVPPHVPDGARLRTLLCVEDNPANLKLVDATHRPSPRSAPADRGERDSRHRAGARLAARRSS